MPQICVIVPVYKVERFLDRCVQSILAQSFGDFELILVDDGSPDRCGALCDAYMEKDKRVRVIHRENGGLSAARNSGIDWVMENSSAQWITFVDSDDWLESAYLSSLFAAVQHTGFLVSACNYYVTRGETIRAEEPFPVKCLSADDYYCSREIPSISVAVGKLYHKDLFQTLRYPIGKLHEDEFTTYRAIYAAKNVAYIPAALYAYYRNEEGIMLSDWNPRRLDFLEAMEQQMADSEEWHNSQLYAKAVRHYIYGIHEQLVASDQSFHKLLRRKYRYALRLGRKCGVFDAGWDHLWAYEEAYPVKLFWWMLFKMRRIAGHLTGRGNGA